VQAGRSDDWLNWPWFTNTHRDLATDLTRWIVSHAEPHAEAAGGTGEPARALYAQLAADGWFAAAELTEPPNRSGLINACLIRELLAYSSAMADVSFSEPWLASLPLQHETRGPVRDFLDRLRAGHCLAAFALSEPGAGSDVAAIATTAKRRGSTYLIDGTKTWTSNAGVADAYVLFAREPAEGPRALSAFVVEGQAPGIALEERLQVLPPHTVGTLRFTDCEVPARNRIGAPGEGFPLAMHALSRFRPTVGAAAVGIARRALDEAMRRSLTRTALGRPICEHQLVQAKLANMVTSIDAASSLVWRAAWQHDHTDTSITQAASAAKLFATEGAQDVIDDAVQIFGGLGVTRGTTVERLYREIRAFRIFDGTSEIQQLIVAKELISQARSSMP
jgi:acyl-CoA dehydrogenase